MDTFVKHLQSPDFLLFSVFLALVLSVLANYLTRIIDRFFASSTSLARGISKRSRDKKAARDLEMANWIDSLDNGAVLALTEANFLSLAGLVFSMIVLLGFAIALTVRIDKAPAFDQTMLLMLFVAFGLLGMGLLSVGGRLRDVVTKHPKGLAGLRRS